jgi:hypothetical protein
MFELSQIAKRFLMVSSQPIKMKGVYASLPRIEEIKLPIIAHMNNSARGDIHFLTYSKIKLRALQLMVMCYRGKNVSEIVLNILQ